MVLVYSAGSEDQTHYIAMEFVEGETLRQRIENHGRLEPREAIAIAVYVAQALQYAWNKSKLIHRDIKPDNIFVSKAGEIKVGDLGLAKNVGQTTAGLTQAGKAMGSPLYMAPEQARGIKEMDFRADIYSLGCTLYHMLTGQPPYSGTDAVAIIHKHIFDPPPAIFKEWPQCPMPLGLLVGKMLTKNPRERHASYEELIAELTAVHEKVAQAQAAAAAPPSGTITFLFTDIEASSRLWEQHPQAMPIALERHNQILRRTVESHGGFVFKTVGDAFCVAFASAPNALAAAMAGQRALAAEPWGETGPLRVRMALHTGMAEARDGDYFGQTLNRVARVLAAGHGGQILLSTATEQLVRDHLMEGTSLSDLGERSLKNLARTERIYQLTIPDLPTQFPTLQAVGGHSPAHRRRQMMVYGGAAAAVVVLAGLFLWSPWKSGKDEQGRREGAKASSTSVQHSNTPTLQQPVVSSAAAALSLLGNIFTNAVGAEMVYIPPGEFLLGSTKEEQAWAVQAGGNEEWVKQEGEQPRKTTIKQGFWMARTEMTVGQWKQFVMETGYVTDAEKKSEASVFVERNQPPKTVKGKSWRDPNFGFEPQDVHPVSCISWRDAVAFCDWLTERERKAGRLVQGCTVRLPTEAEWEYACRAGTQTRFWWGDSTEDEKGRLNRTDKDDGYERVAPVDSYGERGRNRFGLADMLGNVREWCLDYYSANGAHETLQTISNPTRVMRGGGFDTHKIAGCRCASRTSHLPFTPVCYAGFRVVMGADVTGAGNRATSTDPAAAPAEGGILAPAETRVAALTTTPKVGEVFTLPLGGNVTMDLMGIPPGEFLLGSTQEEQAWALQQAGGSGTRNWFKEREGEQPRKAVIKQAFWMGRTEVTVGQWKLFVAETGHVTDAEKEGGARVPGSDKTGGLKKGVSWRNPDFGLEVQEDHPVGCISWNDAVAFCVWLTERERKAGRLAPGQVVRLPTEAEWEYACRAGRPTKFWWDDSKEDSRGRLNWGGKDDGYDSVAPVDSFGEQGRNRFGLADMLGNVWELCLDEYDATQAHEEYWTGNPRNRVLRGGSFSLSPAFCRCASRNCCTPSDSNSSHGFRVVIGEPR